MFLNARKMDTEQVSHQPRTLPARHHIKVLAHVGREAEVPPLVVERGVYLVPPALAWALTASWAHAALHYAAMLSGVSLPLNSPAAIQSPRLTASSLL
jgi:hypothetical protein